MSRLRLIFKDVNLTPLWLTPLWFLAEPPWLIF
jgi:hypothetical protein